MSKATSLIGGNSKPPARYISNQQVYDTTLSCPVPAGNCPAKFRGKYDIMTDITKN
jgi:hypothetical protein